MIQKYFTTDCSKQPNNQPTRIMYYKEWNINKRVWNTISTLGKKKKNILKRIFRSDDV